MDKQLQIFTNPKFGQTRWVEVNNKPYAVGIDVAKSLGYKNPNDAITRHCRGYVKHAVPTESGIQSMNVISEGDIYRLAAKSDLPGAEEFESWIFDEILPSIHRTGMYATNELLDNPDLLIAAATKLKEERAARVEVETKIKALAPKAEFFDQVAESKDAIPIGQAAKVLNMGIGQNNLFKFLREKKILQPDNIPYQEYIDRGYFRIIEQKFTTSNSETRIYIKTLIYQKGLDYIRKQLNNKIS